MHLVLRVPRTQPGNAATGSLGKTLGECAESLAYCSHTLCRATKFGRELYQLCKLNCKTEPLNSCQDRYEQFRLQRAWPLAMDNHGASPTHKGCTPEIVLYHAENLEEELRNKDRMWRRAVDALTIKVCTLRAADDSAGLTQGLPDLSR